MKLSTLLNEWTKQLNQTEQINKYDIQKKINEINKILNLEKLITQYSEESKNCQDIEMIECYTEEIQMLHLQIKEENKNLIEKLLPHQKSSIILEIRSGEGGQEAELFAYELFEMYQKLCKKKNWTFKAIQIQFKESGGIKEVFAEVVGEDVELWLKTESGVHCVKRVPKTEKKGRTHTSTATVAILKQPTDVEVIIKEKDLKIDVFRSSGPGGQSVNTTDSAVRITHLPTGIVVSQQDEKSQHLNKDKAMKVLRARLYVQEKAKIDLEESQARRDAIGQAKRNERIRTYHFNQNWVNDSRLKKKSHDITKFMDSDDLLLFLNELIYFNI